MGKFIDLTGQRFGKLTVIKRAENKVELNGQIRTQFLCKCDCGKEMIVLSNSLKSGLTKSCGCLKGAPIKHNLIGTKIYKVYHGMKSRCYNPNTYNYKYYGGRGIKICDEWLTSFMNFYNWSMTNGYQESLTIDRIDTDKDYEPSNCKWTTVKQQCNNRRNNRLLTFNGETHTIAEWAEMLDMNFSTLRDRLVKCNWSVEDALTKKVIEGKGYVKK